MARQHSVSGSSGVGPKQAASKKHNPHGTSKHNPRHSPQHKQPAQHSVTVTKKMGTHPRAFTLGEFAICVPEAIAASLFVATGYKATQDELLALFFATGSPENGMTIDQGLAVAQEIGLAGFKPKSYAITDKLRPGNIIGTHIPEGSHALTLGNDGVYSWGEQRNMTFLPEEIWKISWQK